MAKERKEETSEDLMKSLEEQLEDLEELSKAGASAEEEEDETKEDLTKEDEEDEEEDEKDEKMDKSFRNVFEPSEELQEAMDVSPLRREMVELNKSLVKGQNILAKRLERIEAGQGVIAKSMFVNGKLMKSVHGSVEVLESLPKPRKSVVVAPLDKSFGGGDDKDKGSKDGLVRVTNPSEKFRIADNLAKAVCDNMVPMEKVTKFERDGIISSALIKSLDEKYGR